MNDTRTPGQPEPCAFNAYYECYVHNSGNDDALFCAAAVAERVAIARGWERVGRAIRNEDGTIKRVEWIQPEDIILMSPISK